MLLRYPAFLLFVFLSVLCKSQVRDAGLWTGVSIEKKFSTSLSASISKEMRLDQNYSSLNSFFSDFGIGYELTPGFKVSGNYRLSSKNKINRFDQRHRYYLDASFKHKAGNLSIGYRIRYQKQYSAFNSSENGDIPENTMRHKLSFAWSFIKPFKTYLAAELFTGLNNYFLFEMERLRYKGGVEYDFNKMNSIDVFYLFQNELFKRKGEQDFIVGVRYKYTF